MNHQERSYKNIATLASDFAKRVKEWYEECIDNGLELLIYCGYRSFEDQEKLYRHGRQDGGTIVTNARGGQSFHNYGRAIDFVPVKNGEAQWNDNQTYKKAQEIGKRHNLRAISWETPHLEDGNYESWRKLRDQFPTGVREVMSQAIIQPAEAKPQRKIGGRGLR